MHLALLFFIFSRRCFSKKARLLKLHVFSRRFRRKCTTLTVASFFRQFNAIGPLFPTSSTWTTDDQNILETPEPRPKQNNRRAEPRKHRIPPSAFFTRIFFRHYATFYLLFWFFFWIPPKSLPFVCFDIFQHNGGPPFTFFGTVTLFKNLI